ncbi:hypothetical protein BDZ97DRAFT_1373598 [Flammula alnicola]|nr:hypothetical protein BDZ97DRAFT_1373598 [Flammula alnicola]
MHDPLLHMHLQVLIALEFKLIDDPSLTTPFIARVDITIEPSDFKVLYKMLETKDKPEEMEGMLQIAAMTAPPYLPLNHTSQKMWNDARREMDDAGKADHPVGLVQFMNHTAPPMTYPITISPNSFEVVRQKLHLNVPLSNGTTFGSPLSILAVVQYINALIRNDMTTTRLRMSMRVADKQLIIDTANGKQSYFARLLRFKMRRECAYLNNENQTYVDISFSRVPTEINPWSGFLFLWDGERSTNH